jgi:hypothetical protein
VVAGIDIGCVIYPCRPAINDLNIRNCRSYALAVNKINQAKYVFFGDVKVKIGRFCPVVRSRVWGVILYILFFNRGIFPVFCEDKIVVVVGISVSEKWRRSNIASPSACGEGNGYGWE